MMSLTYTLRMIAWLPFFPALLRQAKQIRKSVPPLPPASGPAGTTGTSPRTMKLITLGESTIAGIGAGSHREGFTGSLSEALSKSYGATVTWQVFARSGYTAGMLLQNCGPGLRAAGDTDLIVIGLGGNDAFRLTPPWTWRRNILRLIRTLRAQFGEIPILFINMPPVREFPAFTPLIHKVLGSHMDLLGDVLENIADPQKKVWFISEKIELATWRDRLNFRGDPPPFFSDGVHPSPLTYQVWGRETAKFILQNNVI